MRVIAKSTLVAYYTKNPHAEYDKIANIQKI